MTRAPVSPKPLTGGKVLAMLVAFFGVVFGVNMTMMRFAIQTMPGTDVDSAYTASLAYEKEIATAHDQNARNWKVDAQIRRGPNGGATLQVEARDTNGKPMSGLKFQAGSNVRSTGVPISRLSWRRRESTSIAAMHR